ncbi:FIST signal transduction protein [Maribacter sp. ACAM166]|uniref:FIST signal transduction protein n=1 Tax=Maribacter sp. ACAM166 TaxID=2508996 RepID=UPI0010FD8F79|nr:FIST N-terminal domain-containing protein [Maribacter sp. ACAM166]TLP76787.1 histidine kinase [Maribacter sp. ACAM166]
MKIVQAIKKPNEPFIFQDTLIQLNNPLVLVFGNRYMLESEYIYNEVRELFPTGQIVFGTTSGEIINDTVLEGTAVLTAIEFEKSSILVKRSNVEDYQNDDQKLGEELMAAFPKENLNHVFVISEGSSVNGSALISGLEKISTTIGLSGGLCGDGDRFERTLASYNENPKEGEIIAIGFYGETLEISSSNYGGWTPFGPERSITKSMGNVLYELDGKPALDLYKTYLGEKAKELPKSALLYPLSIRTHHDTEPLVRTILTINNDENTMTFAGDVPEGAKVQLMMSSVDDIVNGAYRAAQLAMKGREKTPELALLISCIGRKLVMDQRTEEEIEEVLSVVGNNTVISGFYSYGEMAPFTGQYSCKLHNQTMTLTLLSE